MNTNVSQRHEPPSSPSSTGGTITTSSASSLRRRTSSSSAALDHLPPHVRRRAPPRGGRRSGRRRGLRCERAPASEKKKEPRRREAGDGTDRRTFLKTGMMRPLAPEVSSSICAPLSIRYRLSSLLSPSLLCVPDHFISRTYIARRRGKQELAVLLTILPSTPDANGTQVGRMGMLTSFCVRIPFAAASFSLSQAHTHLLRGASSEAIVRRLSLRTAEPLLPVATRIHFLRPHDDSAARSHSPLRPSILRSQSLIILRHSRSVKDPCIWLWEENCPRVLFPNYYVCADVIVFVFPVHSFGSFHGVEPGA
ncbi:hypothetical protein B296_00020752 [Ensete ventricosum]|uniref:Uncharacterized protein n=1 Tax=Ensete ventricosum TaxID=4639 RepID=A0A427A4R7_ENSVE|nr:hypothetical protein B296_00020752 [Ensete ventricosum]